MTSSAPSTYFMDITLAVHNLQPSGRALGSRARRGPSPEREATGRRKARSKSRLVDRKTEMLKTKDTFMARITYSIQLHPINPFSSLFVKHFPLGPRLLRSATSSVPPLSRVSVCKSSVKMNRVVRGRRVPGAQLVIVKIYIITV